MFKKSILEFLSDASRSSEEIFAFFVGGSGYGSRGGISGGLRAVKQLKRARASLDPAGEYLRLKRKRIRELTQALKHDKLIVSVRGLSGVQYEITGKGREKIVEYNLSDKNRLPKKRYPRVQSDKIIIIVYDIPHAKRRFRDWLRSQLVSLGFKMLQKSVFLGKIKVPEGFIDDLIQFSLIEFVEIFEITKQGTLRSSKNNKE